MTLEKTSFDSIVVGGGLIGLLVARSLHDAGLSVAVCERGEIARESSWAGGGILSPLYPWRYDESVNTLAAYSQRVYPELAQDLYDQTGIDPEYTRSGILVALPDDEVAATDWARQRTLAVESVSADRIKTIEPELELNENALWFPEIAQIRNPRLAQALRRDLEKKGVRLYEFTEVERIVVDSGKICGIETREERFEAPHVVVASGAWTPELLNAFGLHYPIVPVRGQMLQFHTSPGFIKHMVLIRGRYAIPRRDGLVLVGSTLEDVGFNKSITDEGRDELLDFVDRYLPALRRFPLVQHWAGLRPGSPGGVPVIGEHPLIKGLYVSAGHFRNGVVLAPATARIITDLITGNTPIFTIEPYRWR